MYSVVLATMLSAGGAATPAWHHCHSCSGCFGGYSGYAGYSGYSGYGCSGCSRCSGCFGCHGCGLFQRFHSCGYSSCGYSSCGCSWSCCGGVVISNCCTASVCCGAPVCCGGQPAKVVPVPEKVDSPKKKGTGDVSVPSNVARVTVNLPSDARMWVENVEAPLTSSVRTFTTPALNPNQQYFYNIRAEIVRDGRTITETQRVIITPGQEARVDFNTSDVIGSAAR
jgi:uncharacterized protein (TIGR03000 family)